MLVRVCLSPRGNALVEWVGMYLDFLLRTFQETVEAPIPKVYLVLPHVRCFEPKGSDNSKRKPWGVIVRLMITHAADQILPNSASGEIVVNSFHESQLPGNSEQFLSARFTCT